MSFLSKKSLNHALQWYRKHFGVPHGLLFFSEKCFPRERELAQKILEFIANDPDIEAFLPDLQDLPKTPKQWLVNVCAAVVNEPFKTWVGQQVEDRNALMAEKRDMMIAMDPVMAQKFATSTHISRKSRPNSPLD